MLGGKFRAPAHEGANCGWRGVKDSYAVFLYDTPQPFFVRPIRRAFIHDLRYPVCHRAIDDVCMTGDPANIGGAPENIVVLHVENPLVCQCHAGQIAARCMKNSLRLPGCSTCIERSEERRVGKECRSRW